MRFVARHIFIVMLLTIAVAPVEAEDALTEARAVELGLSRIDVRDWLDGQRAAVAAEARGAGRWTNPQIEYNREDLDLPLGRSRETAYWLRQSFNISGQLGLERDAARQQQRAEEADIDLAKRSLVAEIRHTFYQAMQAAQRADTLQSSAERLAKLSDALIQRARAGDVSRYDSLRLQREAALLHGQATTARAQADALREQLSSLIGTGDTASLTGDLMPPPIQAIAELEQRLPRHPQMRHLVLETDAQRLTAKAAGREAWPELTLGVGQRELTEPGVAGDGDMVAIGIEIPLFERGAHKRDHANARMRTLQAEQRLLHQRLLAELRGTVQLLQARRQAADALSESVNSDAPSLIAIAERAYWGGEMQVMELLDAYRAEREAQLESLALQLAARMAYIELQTLTGEP